LAKRLLDQQGVGQLFQAYLLIPELDKGLAIRNFCWAQNIDLATVLFVDDDRNNITCARMQGIKTCHVTKGSLTAALLQKYLPS
jgi:hypothetical protein